jgi:hypothetical protein
MERRPQSYQFPHYDGEGVHITSLIKILSPGLQKSGKVSADMAMCSNYSVHMYSCDVPQHTSVLRVAEIVHTCKHTYRQSSCHTHTHMCNSEAIVHSVPRYHFFYIYRHSPHFAGTFVFK